MLPGMSPILHSSPSSSKPSTKHLSPAEMQLRQDKGLCYACDEKFSPTHRCPSCQFLLLQYEDDPLVSFGLDLMAGDSLLPLDTSAYYHHLSHNALHGASGFATLCFTGTILGHKVHVLLDSGSQDNFIQPRLAKFLHLDIENPPHHWQWSLLIRGVQNEIN
ncbi:hypothetical protein NMG60_11015020 [Bertholletia excelsa]